MPIEVYIPKMSDHMEEAVFLMWLVEEGQAVTEGEPLFEVETDKADAEVPSPAEGFLVGIRAGISQGMTVLVGETIAFIAASLDEAVPSLPPLGVRGGPPGGVATTDPRPETSLQQAVDSSRESRSAGASRGDGPVPAVPAARRLAAEHGIDLSQVASSGPQRRITLNDVQAYLDSSTRDGEDTHRAHHLTRIQRITGERMVDSVRSAPQFAIGIDVDMAALVALREGSASGSGSEQTGAASLTAYLVRALALALREHPRLAAAYEEDARLRPLDTDSVGVAVATDQGLFVPVVREAATKLVDEIASELAELAARSRSGKLTAHDLEGGGITLSNLGMYGIDEFRAIVNPPQAAILATGRVRRELAMIDGAIESIPRMRATLSVDHRVADGAQAAQLLTRFAELIATTGEERG